jgi:branched-chain amino acid transport system ATP-binding protein
VLEVDRVTVEFGGLVAVNALSFSVPPGEVCAIIGPNGAGKTTIFNAITGFVPLRSGDIKFDGVTIAGLPPHKVAARGISRTFQYNGLIRDMTVLENVILGMELHTPSTFFGIVLGLRKSLRAEDEAVERALSMLRKMNIAGLAGTMAGDLPFGQQRLVEISRALVSGARLLLLDEPAVGLFEIERQTLCAALKQLASEGVAVLLIEHVLDVVRSVASRVIVMNYGEKLVECRPDELRTHQSVLDAYSGHA